MSIQIEIEKCDGCGTCVEVCPMGVFEIKDEESSVVKVDDCIQCGSCEAECPNLAIELIAEWGKDVIVIGSS